MISDKRPNQSSQSGFTLIEVMVGFMLTTILLLGMTGIWKMVDKQFYQVKL